MSQHMVEKLETWMHNLNFAECTLAERRADRLVYDIGGPQNLEVHSAVPIELDGRPMLIPACVVLTGNTNYEFFDDIAGLFRYVCVNRSESKERQLKDREIIKKWVEEWFTEQQNADKTFNWRKATPNECHTRTNFCFYVTRANKSDKIIEIIPALRGNSKACIRLQKPLTDEYFKDQKELGKCIDKLLRKES